MVHKLRPEFQIVNGEKLLTFLPILTPLASSRIVFDCEHCARIRFIAAKILRHSCDIIVLRLKCKSKVLKFVFNYYLFIYLLSLFFLWSFLFLCIQTRRIRIQRNIQKIYENIRQYIRCSRTQKALQIYKVALNNWISFDLQNEMKRPFFFSS